jgi:hypothetical protein
VSRITVRARNHGAVRVEIIRWQGQPETAGGFARVLAANEIFLGWAPAAAPQARSGREAA